MWMLPCGMTTLVSFFHKHNYIPANSHACGLKTLTSCKLVPTRPISHTWLKKWHTFQKYIASNSASNKVHVEWEDDNAFPEISDFWMKDTGDKVMFADTHPEFWIIWNVFKKCSGSSERIRKSCLAQLNWQIMKILNIVQHFIRESNRFSFLCLVVITN